MIAIQHNLGFYSWLRGVEKLSDFSQRLLVAEVGTIIHIFSFHFSFASVQFAFKYYHLFILATFIYELLAGKIIWGWIFDILKMFCDNWTST